MKKIKTNWLYSQTVKEHFLNPKNVLWDEKNYQFDGKGTAGNPVCGDVMMVWIKLTLKPKKSKIVNGGLMAAEQQLPLLRCSQ